MVSFVSSEYVYFTEASVTVFNGLRVYALTHRICLSVFVFFLSSVQFITNMVCRLGPHPIDTRSKRAFQTLLLKYPFSDIYFDPWGCLELTGPPASLNRMYVSQ